MYETEITPTDQGGVVSAGQQPAAEQHALTRKKKTVETTKVHPPLLALIDILFTLMLFFVIAAKTRLAEGEIPGSLPDTRGNGSEFKIDNPITITLRQTNDLACQYELDGRVVSETEKLFEWLSSRPGVYGTRTLEDVPVLIRPIKDVRWRWAVEAYNQAVRAGYHKVSFGGRYL